MTLFKYVNINERAWSSLFKRCKINYFCQIWFVWIECKHFRIFVQKERWLYICSPCLWNLLELIDVAWLSCGLSWSSFAHHPFPFSVCFSPRKMNWLILKYRKDGTKVIGQLWFFRTMRNEVVWSVVLRMPWGKYYFHWQSFVFTFSSAVIQNNSAAAVVWDVFLQSLLSWFS